MKSFSQRFNGLALPFTMHLSGAYHEGLQCLWHIHGFIQNERPLEKHSSVKTPGVLRHRTGNSCSMSS